VRHDSNLSRLPGGVNGTGSWFAVLVNVCRLRRSGTDSVLATSVTRWLTQHDLLFRRRSPSHDQLTNGSLDQAPTSVDSLRVRQQGQG
jgi:hypothetical protein